MSRGIGRFQQNVLAILAAKAWWGWTTDSRDILFHLFPSPEGKELRYGRGHAVGYGMAPVDDDGVVKNTDDIKRQYRDYPESQKAQVRYALRALEKRRLIMDVSESKRRVHLKEWLPNPPPPEYLEVKTRREARSQRFLAGLRG